MLIELMKIYSFEDENFISLILIFDKYMYIEFLLLFNFLSQINFNDQKWNLLSYGLRIVYILCIYYNKMV